MPFTFSHPALVLPLQKVSRNVFSLTGLVVGSITPDFEYFIRMGMHTSISHTLDGLFWFDLPLGLLLTFVFHNLIRNPLYENLPLRLRMRVSDYKSFNWNTYFKAHWLNVVLSVLVGAATHLFWDAFTHNRAYFVQLFPVLNIDVIVVMGEWIPVYRILQHISTVAGAVVIARVIFIMPASGIILDQPNPKYWPLVSVVVLIIVILRLFFGIEQNLLGQLAGTFTSAFLIALVTTPFLIRKNLKTHDL